MSRVDLNTMSTEELWLLYEQIRATLQDRLAAERDRIEDRLRSVASFGLPVPPRKRAAAGRKRTTKGAAGRKRRPYPKVLPKYRNPKNPSETWSGRGKQPRWLVAELRRGKKPADFLIK